MINLIQSADNKFSLRDQNEVDVFEIDVTALTVTIHEDYTFSPDAFSFVDLDLGSSGAVGSLDLFPATASKGKLHLVATDNTNNDTITITNAAFGQASTITLPDPGNATASIVLTKGTQTLSGTTTFSGTHNLSGAVVTTGKLTLGNGVVPDTVSFAAAAGASDICNVTITVKDGTASPVALATARTVLVWLSDAATGLGATAVTASGTVTATTGTDLVDLTAKKVKVMQTDVNGVIVLAITDAAKTGFYVCATPLGSPHGKHQVSAQLVGGDYGA